MWPRACSVTSVMSNSLWPHGLQPTRLLCPWNFPGKNTGVGLPCPSLGNLPNPGIKPVSPAVQVDFFFYCGDTHIGLEIKHWQEQLIFLYLNPTLTSHSSLCPLTMSHMSLFLCGWSHLHLGRYPGFFPLLQLHDEVWSGRYDSLRGQVSTGSEQPILWQTAS